MKRAEHSAGFQVAWVGLVALLAGGCTWLNALDVCHDSSSEFRVNQTADQNESLEHPQAAARLADGRLLVAYTARALDNSSAQARLVLMNPSDGTRATPCGSAQEEVLSANGYGATAAACPLAPAAAAVGWVEIGQPNHVQVAFLDAAGCPLAPGPFSPGVGIASSDGIALAWSAQRRAVLATYDDGRHVYASWLAAPGTSSAELLDQGALVGPPTVSAVAPNGRVLVAWNMSSTSEALEFQSHVRAILLDSDGAVLQAPLAGGARSAFTLDFPATYMPNTGETASLSPQLAVAASAGRFAIALTAAVEKNGRPALFVRQLDDSGAPLGGALAADPHGDQDQTAPALAYAPGGSLVVAWQSTARGGTVARLFDANLSPRFNTLSCSSDSFALGARANQALPGYPVLVQANAFASGDLLAVHPATPSWDSNGSGVLAWRMSFAELWPAR